LCSNNEFSSSTFLAEALDKAKKCAESLDVKLEESEKAREKAEQDVAAVGDLRQRLHTAENALSERVSQQIAREKSIINRLETQNRRFVSKYSLLPLSVLITSCLSRY
jgi:archaellum component FlaC